MQVEQLSLLPSTVHPLSQVWYCPKFLETQVADEIYEHCQHLNWKHNQIRMFGKLLDLPRLEVMHGDSTDYRYLYSKSVELIAEPWTIQLDYVRRQIERVTQYKFQLVIGNWYRCGSDHIGWHSDSEPSMGKRPAIASLSLGNSRRFQLRPKKGKGATVTYELSHGDLILMLPGCQDEMHHRLVKESKPCGERINLTFRPWVK